MKGSEPTNLPSEVQLHMCRGWCEMSGVEVYREYRDDGLSGRRAENRPDLQKALRDVCRVRGVLVVHSLSRLARNTSDAIEIFRRIEKVHANLVSLREEIDTTCAMGRFVFTLMAAIAELERGQISERTRDAMHHHQANGRRMSDCCPYGWRRRKDNPALMEQDEHEQAIIARIIAERQAGRKLRQICRILEQDGLTCRGGPWYHQTIKRILERTTLV
jgi:site-specific DNA recombinase